MSPQSKIAVSHNGCVHFVRLEEILYFKSSNCYVQINTKDSNNYFIISSLTSLEKKIGGNFFIKVGQSYIVNKELITKVDKKNKIIYFMKDKFVPFTISIKELVSLLDNCEFI